ncbi:MAG: family 10 glycosylhydrolase [Phycisphaerae bacterium]|nr:family 10 glycosylhydrolase [Phycisphaerae bacterium]
MSSGIRCANRRLAIMVGALLVGVVPAVGAEVIVDNLDSGFTVLSGDWTEGAYAGYYGTNYRWVETSGEPFSEVEWRPNLPAAGAYEVAVWYVQGGNRANNAPFTIDHASGSDTVYVNQQAYGSQWFVLGVYDFAAGTAGRVRLSNTAGPSVVIADAVRFVSTDATALTMAVNPPNAGTTSPAVGGPYSYDIDEVVPISASAASGYTFDHWQVSGGSNVASPSSPTTTVTMDQSKTVTAVFTGGAVTGPELRAFWADAFHDGYKSTAQIDEMIANAVAGNYNAIIPEVLAFQDDVSASGHGAYWNSSIVPKAKDIEGGIDPLAYMVQQAHAVGLEVHCWLVAFRVCATWPPSGNSVVQPEWLMVPRAQRGTVATVGGYYTLDPGAAGAQEYLCSIVNELVSNYAIDGIHWDYIRYTQTDAGYPTDLSDPKSSLARFQAITGRVDVPPATGDTEWNDFRRRTITEVVRRVQAEIPMIGSNPRQPVRHSAALIMWGNAPATFEGSSAYGIFQNWREWMELGYIDTGIPMAYFREYNTDQAQWYRNWVDAAIAWQYDRQMCIGPGIYLNSFADSVTQIQYARNAGAAGFSTYSYRGTNNMGMPWDDWYPYAGVNVFTSPVATPTMPWRDPATATEGTLYGQVTDYATGEPVDDATVQVGAAGTVKTDGNGYYVLTMINAAASGTSYDVTASKSGLPSATHLNVQVVAGDVRREDLALGAPACVAADFDCDGDVDLTDFSAFQGCFNGPNRAPAGEDCDGADVDSDNDVDLTDFGAFQSCFNGPNRAPACAL